MTIPRSQQYTAFDGLGNVLAVAGTSSTGAVEYASSATYDARNRLASWQHGGAAPVYYGYDAGLPSERWREHREELANL